MHLIAYDLGTGGLKASLYDSGFSTQARVFVEYPMFYPAPRMHEQCPEHWWDAVVRATRALLEKSGVASAAIACVCFSGASLVAIPMDASGQPLLKQVPIWSDTRAVEEADAFFQKVNHDPWYMATGNGFPAPCYSIFKLMWMKKHQPEVFAKTAYVLGSKDYLNYRLTGVAAMDSSYASGTGAFDLIAGAMREDFLQAVGLPQSLFPLPVPPHTVIGKVTRTAAEQTGLREGTPVACGGVDNACMALGAVGTSPGKAYFSLGSSSWIAVNATRPILDVRKKPYVFAHIGESAFTSAFSIFAGGSSLRWVRETLCGDLPEAQAYDLMNGMAARAPIGANGVFFNPSLAGGTSQDKSIHIRGSYMGLHLGTTREDMIRAAMEGIAMNLRQSLDLLKRQTPVSDPLLICGGGSKSRFWQQMFADVFRMKILKSNVDQDAASLGAAAIAARALGWWKDYAPIAAVHRPEHLSVPEPGASAEYARLLPIFRRVHNMADMLGAYIHSQTNGVSQ